jgi:glycogen debranching enzyme
MGAAMIARIRKKFLLKTGFALCLTASLLTSPVNAQSAPNKEGGSLLIERPVRTWEFLCAVGKRAGVFGNESGRVEAWVYPLKILRDFHVTIHNDGKEIPAEALVRTIEARPEATTLVYAGDTFSIRETFFVPVDEPGALIKFEVETEQPLELEVAFHRDFALEWPAAVGGTYANWNEKLNAFGFGEESKRFAAVIGSPTAREPKLEYESNYASTHENSLRLGVTAKGRETKILAIAGSVHGQAEAETTYKILIGSYAALKKESAAYYAEYLKRTISVELPDETLQKAYDWSRVSLAQGMVTNPTMGTGLVAGYRTSGESQRPGFAWFFGRDAFWSTLALNSEGDFLNAKAALSFVAQFQRDDGKMPHEIAQGASFVNWFKDYPYGFASADATPLYLIAMNDYVKASGDVEFAKANWDHLWRAYQFLNSTYADGVPKNFGIGHGWVEGGPLLPVKSEFYQSGLAVEAKRALGELAKSIGKEEDAKKLVAESDRERAVLNSTYWSPEKQIYAFAVDNQNKRMDEASVLATVPMWFGLVDEKNASEMISKLAGHEHATDWGMRIISNKSPIYSGAGYHFGSVWPLFTGWAAVGEYRYHREQPAYANLRANALLGLNGSPGHVTEVLSGDYYQTLSTASPHQIWSAAMVISPVLRGMLGLQTDAKSRTLTFSPHLPAAWSGVGIKDIRVGDSRISLSLKRTEGSLTLEMNNADGKGEYTVDFRPAISPRAKVTKAELDGKPVAFKLEATENDQHIALRIPLRSEKAILRVAVANDFAVDISSNPPQLGKESEGLRLLSESWSATKDRLDMEVSGATGHTYQLDIWNGGQIAKVEGATLVPAAHDEWTHLSVKVPESSEQYATAHLAIQFKTK